MTETLRGQVESIRIVRDGWGWLVLLFGSAVERATVTGHPLGVEIGDTIEVDGAWTTHARYGRQFRAREIRTVAPSDAVGVIEWMRARLPNVGRKLATTIVERFGVEETWRVLEHAPHELVALSGITPERAAAIHAEYMKHLDERDRIVALKRWALTDRQIARIHEALGLDAINVIRRDPYVLITTVTGFGWARADALAQRMGLPLDHPSRIRAGLEFLLSEAAIAGHTYVPAGKLIAMAARVLGVDEAAVVREGREAIASGRMVQREARAGHGTGHGTRIYAPRIDHAEQAVADAVRRLVRGEPKEGSEAA